LRCLRDVGTPDAVTAATRPIDPAFPEIAPEVVDAYHKAPDTMVAEVLNDEP
jgi:hypothetical protein